MAGLAEAHESTARVRASRSGGAAFAWIRERRLAERVGFEPTCRLPDKTLSRRPRYDHFGTSPVTRGSAEQVIITGAFP